MKDKMMSGNETMDAAIAWHVRLAEQAASADEWEAFTAWLEEKPTNADAYDVVARSDVDLTDVFDVAQRDPYLSDNDNEIVEVPWYRRRGFFAVAASVALAIIVSPALTPGRDMQTFTTKLGETREIALSDGSSVSLNGGTVIMLDRQSDRFAELKSGEAVFTVRHDPRKPFVIEMQGVTLRDIGTIFNVRHDEVGLKVAVSEGAVEYVAKKDTITVSAGNQLYVASGGKPNLSKIDADAVGGWRQGRLTYQATEFGTIAADLGRSLGTPVTVRHALADRRFTGVIQVNAEEAVVFRRVESLLGVRARKNDKGWELTP
jgi:transmembrane sensor